MSYHTPTKENNGKAARRQWMRHFLVFFLGGVAALGIVLFLVIDKYGHADHKSGRRSIIQNALRSNNNNNNNNNKIEGVYATHRLTHEELLHEIAHARWTLVDIYPTGQLTAQPDNGNSYHGVVGEFCPVSWHDHKQDPSRTPMFRDVLAQNLACASERRQTMELSTVMQHVQAFDEARLEQHDPESSVHVLELKAVAFHESRCGSTLIANLLQAWDPERHRVYSESGPPVAALRICGEDGSLCAHDLAVRVVQDVIALMSRSNDPLETFVFFKIQSIGSRQLHVWQHAFPDVPWFYLYRDPVQVLMSQLRQGPRNANCVRPQRAAHQPPSIVALLDKYEVHNVQQLSPTDYCALHLASLTSTAVRLLNDHAMPLDYSDQLAEQFTTYARYRLHLPWNTDVISPRLAETAQKYSKGRGGQARDFQGDSHIKEQQATDAMRQAAQRFLQDSYSMLQHASRQSWKELEAVMASHQQEEPAAV
jgi:hypothetical protein